MKTPNLSRARAAALAAALGLGTLLAALPARAAELLDERIDIRVEKADVADLFKTFAQIAGLKLDIAPAVQGKVSLVLEHVRLETALDAASESAGCRWQIADGKLRVEPVPGAPAGGSDPAEGDRADRSQSGLDSRIDLNVTGAGAPDLLQTFAELLSAGLDLDPAVKGAVTLNLEHAPCRDALDAICGQAGCTWKLLPGERPTLQVKAKR